MPITSGATKFPLADEDTPFDVTLAVAGTAQDWVAVPGGKKGRSISLVNEGPGTAFIAFDSTATLTSLVLDRGDMYSEALLEISTKVSFVGQTGLVPRVRGILWSGL